MGLDHVRAEIEHMRAPLGRQRKEILQLQRAVQAIIVAIDQYAETALGNRDYFLNKPYGVG